jgi:hypothetical protein
MRLSGILKLTVAATMAMAVMAAPLAALAQGGNTVLKPADTPKLLPASVYYKGLSATTQLRNSGGVKFADGYYVLATMVDTSGYASGIAAKYQAYFITEVPLTIGGKSLSAGVYGVGFVGDSQLVVTDVGAHDVLTVSSTEDAGLKRPTPLQVTVDPAGGFRLYAGRKYVVFSR